ncbi:hypothetical protein AGMMS49928_05060 [Spirochaetia bacterium]|nr:hypothetical protein AGMMS49928_05060 [Spirochaetia bacterium]
MFSTLADGTPAKYAMTEPVEIRWKDRAFPLPAQVIPSADEILLGALPWVAGTIGVYFATISNIIMFFAS